MEKDIVKTVDFEDGTEFFSYTRLDTYRHCGFKYKLCYVDGKRFYTGSVATEFGTIVHETEENIARSIISKTSIDYDGLINNFKSVVDGIREKYPDDFYVKDKSGISAEDKANIYLTTGVYRLENLMKNNPGYELVDVEKEFTFLYRDKYAFKGFIDRIIYDTRTKKYIVQDIKTYTAPLKADDLTNPLQFVVYVLAAAELFNVPYTDFECSYDLPLCNLIQSATMPMLLFSDFNDELDRILGNIDNRYFEPNPTALCHWCDFCPTNPHQPEEAKDLCPYYSLWTRENRTKKTASDWLGLKNHDYVLKEYLIKKQKGLVK